MSTRGERDVREVMALAQHLRADERLRLAAAEAVEDAHQLPFLARRVAVEHVDGDVGKIAAEALLHFLRAEADRLQHFAVAQRTLRRNRLAQSAVVADQQSRRGDARSASRCSRGSGTRGRIRGKADTAHSRGD